MTTSLKTPNKPNPSNNNTVSKVRVIVRVRPFLPHDGNSLSCVSAQSHSPHDQEVSVLLNDQDTSRSECYKLDGFFGEGDNGVAKIFEKEVRPLIVPGLFRGCNATVFAYGATGSGKTYTMQGTDEQPGLMPLAMSTVLSMCPTTGTVAEISYYEVYLDRCYDLLELKAKEISVLDDKEGQIHLRGLSRVSVSSMSEFHEVFKCGVQRRKVAHTGLNDVSSRSHAVLVITVSAPSDDGGATVTGKLSLIDLAGNEDNKRSGNEGIRMQESAKINQSLFALSNVIYALNNNKSWVPYRESKLTRILQDSLGGTSRALMVACLNPGDYQESVHTVSLAARSRHVSNVVPSAQKHETPKVKIDMEAKLRAWRELKGTTKSAQRTGAFGSPFFINTPGSVSSIKKQSIHQSSVKAKVTGEGKTTANDRLMSEPQRKLFDNEAPSDSGKVVFFQELEDKNDCLSGPDESLIVGHLSSDLEALDFACSNRSLTEMQEPVTEDTIKELIVDTTGSKSPDELLEEDEKTESDWSSNLFRSPPNRLKIKGCQSPLRKALSPVNCNIARMPIMEVSSRDNVTSVLLESNTPRTPFVVTREKLMDFDTPLDKFNARSSNLKSFLAEEYIDFLNSATREELVELKGIGAKRAQYIIELRDTSPLKTLNDLEKIGLSSKQVQHMFSKAARGIFE